MQPVWDLPVRLFHWTLAGLIGFSWWSAENHHLDWHMWSGFAILTALIFRLLWGLFGSSTARFKNFVRGPRALNRYLRGEWRGIGHTPLGALGVVALLGATAIQVGLGLFAEDEDGLFPAPLSRFVSIDTSDKLRDIHEAWFNVVLGLIILHLAAIAFYRVVRKQRLTAPMITGMGAIDAEAEPMRPGKWWVALLCLVAALAITRWIVAGAPPFSP